MMDPDIESLLYLENYSSNRKENVEMSGPSSGNTSTTPLKHPKKRPRTLTPIHNDPKNQKQMEARTDHSDINGRFKCTTCNKAFRLPSLLRRHEIIHTGEKPFKCRYCDQAFGRVDHRQVHERIHKNEYPWVCACGRKFRQLGLLKYHRRREHPESVDDVLDNAREVNTEANDMNQDNQNSTDMGMGLADKKDSRRGREKKMIENGFKCKLCSQSFLYVRHCHRHLSMVHKISDKEERSSLILEPSDPTRNLTDSSSQMEFANGEVPELQVPDPDELNSDIMESNGTMPAIGIQEDEAGQAGNDFHIYGQEEEQISFDRGQSDKHQFSWTEEINTEWFHYTNSLDLIYNQPLNDWSFLYYC